jgi:hypothetical protein
MDLKDFKDKIHEEKRRCQVEGHEMDVADVMGVVQKHFYLWRGDGTDELGQIGKLIIIDEEGLMGLVLHGEDMRRALWRK